MTYEYWVRSCPPLEPHTDAVARDLEHTLNRAALERWEFVSISEGFIIFRRLFAP